uniref:TNFR2_mb1 n=1 Tax=synthetic construct TaxID=32630 RepID=UPI00387FB204
LNPEQVAKIGAAIDAGRKYLDAKIEEAKKTLTLRTAQALLVIRSQYERAVDTLFTDPSAAEKELAATLATIDRLLKEHPELAAEIKAFIRSTMAEIRALLAASLAA